MRTAARQLEQKIHAEELAAGEVRHQRSSLADRLRDDYGIELAELEHEPSDEEQHQREEVQEEIDQLRRKINNLGNVNLEALAELDELEKRHETLATQYKDLAGAKSALERIIALADDQTRIIPGHGALADRKGATASLEMLKRSRKLVRELVEAGRTEEEILEANPLAKYHDDWNWRFITTERMTKMLVRSLTEK